MISFLTSLFKSFFQNYTKLSLKEVKNKLKNNYFDIIIDVRSEKEYNKGLCKSLKNLCFLSLFKFSLL